MRTYNESDIIAKIRQKNIENFNELGEEKLFGYKKLNEDEKIDALSKRKKEKLNETEI